MTRVRSLWTILSAILFACSTISLLAPSAAATTTPDAAATCIYDRATTSALPARAPSRPDGGAYAVRGARSKAVAAPVSQRVEGSTLAISSQIATNSAPPLVYSSKQLQAKFKHAADFGVAGNYSKANATNFSRALNQHINSSTVTKTAGTYRGNPVTHYLDASTGLNVIVDPAGVFVSGWKLGPAQLQNVLTHGGLT